MTAARETHSCGECGLIYEAVVLNMVSGDREGLLGNYCPNCGSEDVTPGVEER